MKPIIKTLFTLLVTSTFTFAQEASPSVSNAWQDHLWLENFLQPYSNETTGGFDYSKELLVPLLKDEETYNRLLRMVQRAAAQVPNQERFNYSTYKARRLLSWTGTDEAVDAIAPFLKHSSFRVRKGAANTIQETQNPKAVPYLEEALKAVETRLPSALETLGEPPDLEIVRHNERVSKKFTEMQRNNATREELAKIESEYIGNTSPDEQRAERGAKDIIWELDSMHMALRYIGTENALAAVDESIKRIEKKNGASKRGKELATRLRKEKDEAIQWHKSGRKLPPVPTAEEERKRMDEQLLRIRKLMQSNPQS